MEHPEYVLHYIASPYTHSDPEVREKRYEEVEEATLILLRQGHYGFSPIAYNHPMGRHNLPTTWDFWEPFDKAFLERCSSIVVLMLEGWNTSLGVQAEIDYAIKIGLPVQYLEPTDVFSEGFIFEPLC